MPYHTLHAEQGMANDLLPLSTTAKCAATSTGGEKLGVGGQNMVGELCKNVLVRLADRMVHRG